MRRGDVLVLRDTRFASKARPVVVVQADGVEVDTVIMALLTSHDRGPVPFRVPVEPSSNNGLKVRSFVMAGKLATVRRNELGQTMGALTASDMRSMAQAVDYVLDVTTIMH